MKAQKLFSYSWHIDHKEVEITSIRIYGINEANENVCLRVDNFYPYVYIELPDHVRWDDGRAGLVAYKLNSLMPHGKGILDKEFCIKKKLYGAHMTDIKTMERKKFPYLKLYFSTAHDIRALSYKLKHAIHIVGIGAIQLKMHESDADPILQLTSCRKLPTAGWIKFIGKKQEDDDKITTCDHEYTVRWKKMAPTKSKAVIKPKIMGFDIEVNSTIPSAFPKAERVGDKVFQISCVFSLEGDIEENYKKYILTLGDPYQNVVGDNVIIQRYKTEASLLMGFTDLIRLENPNIITGYNILGFDIPYMIARAKFNMCIFDFDRQGFPTYKHAEEKIIKWSSQAYGTQEFVFLDAEGRVFIDLLPLVKRDYKFSNYKLKTIAEYFIGKSKDPLSVKGIFKCYKIGIKKNKKGEYAHKARKAMGIVAKYCVMDSILVVRLMDKLKTWVGLTEMATVCNVPIFSLYTQGQQKKVYAQLYKYCMYENIVVEKDGYKVGDNERYVGAKVFPPKPGQYEMVVPFDFASLYPTTIIAYNIDYHTWVPDDSDIPNRMCHVLEWEDHVGCQHDPKVIRRLELTAYIDSEKIRIKKMRDRRNKSCDKYRKKEMMDEINIEVEKLKPYVKERSNITRPKFPMCEARSYRFLKEPRGVMPTVIQNLLDARKHTRKVDMIKCYDEIDRLKAETKETGKDNTDLITSQHTLLDVLNKRQLAFKVSANSMYGAMGVRRGYLPFMPGAMCTTYMGRTNIEVVADIIPKKYKGELIYGDTDSNYIHFPHLSDPIETWDYALFVASEVTKLFPPPIELEFEEEIYTFFLILSKKRYMYRKISKRGGETSSKIGHKGVLLTRRDNSKFTKDVYAGLIGMIADSKSRDDILYYILQQMNNLCGNCKPREDFIITKSVGSCGDLSAIPFINDKGVEKAKVGDYTVTPLSNDQDIRKQQLSKKEVTTHKDYYLKCLPAQVQLAEKMRSRGVRVAAGSRLEYVVSHPDKHTAKQYDKLESFDYMEKHPSLVKIDFLYYLKSLVNPVDQVLNVAFGNDKDFKLDFTMRQYKLRWKVFNKCMKEIRDTFKPSLVFSG